VGLCIILLSYLCIGCQSTNNSRILKENNSTLTIQPSNSIKENGSGVENSNTQTKPIEEYYKLSKNDDESYTIILYDNAKNIIHQETVEKEPYIDFEDEKIIRVTHSVGSSLNYTYFYDIVKGEISQVYENVLLIEKDLVLYMNDNILIISNIFDNNLYYKEIKRNFSQTAVPSSAILSIKFVGPNLIQLDYLEGKDLKEKT
jgi:uncharacterized protein YcfL